MAHMRAEDEREMMSQTLQVDYIETAGEIGALLLESNLIKTLNPIFNVRLRRLRKLCAIQIGLQVKTCLGACVGQEQREIHDERLMKALADLKVHAWPFSGAIDLVEQNDGWTQRHRIQDWRYLSTACSKSGLLQVSVQQSFDLDTYKILVKPIMLGTACLELVDTFSP